MRKGRVKPESRHHDANAVRPNDAHEMRPCGVECRLLQRATPLPEFGETGSDDHSAARPVLAQFTDQ